MKNFIQNALLTLMSVMCALSLFEIYLRATEYVPKKVSIAPPYLFANHPQTWWTLRPNFKKTVKTVDGEVTYAINSQGLRAPRTFTTDAQMPRIFVIGDSYTFGVGIDEALTFARLLEGRLKNLERDREVINLGVAGFGTHQSYQRLREYSEIFGTPEVLIYVFCPNDPVDNITGKKEVVYGIRVDSARAFKPLMALLGHSYHLSRSVAFVLDRLYDRHFNPRKLKRRELEGGEVPVRQREDFVRTREYLADLIGWSEERGVELLVLTTDHSIYSGPLKSFLSENGVPVMEAPDIFARLNEEDLPVKLLEGHWNSHAHRMISRALADYLLSEFWEVETAAEGSRNES